MQLAAGQVKYELVKCKTKFQDDVYMYVHMGSSQVGSWLCQCSLLSYLLLGLKHQEHAKACQYELAFAH